MLYTTSTLPKLSRHLHESRGSIVLATGFFDLLHTEHKNFLRRAKEAGDILVVAVESDARARAVKGEGRPVEPHQVRCHKVSQFADFVIALGDDFNNQEAYESLIATLRPDIYAVSSHTSYLENKESLVKKYGGLLKVVHVFNPRVSTTAIIEQAIISPNV